MIPLSPDLRAGFPELVAMDLSIKDVTVAKRSNALEDFKGTVQKRTRNKYDLEKLKDDAVFRCYRDFFWRLGIDPTKIRPASEALVRRILQGKSIPKINTLVDAYNLASIESGIALAAFDEDKLRSKPRMRFAKAGERFLGIGMTEESSLKGGEIIMEDDEKLVAVYPYRDADNTKVTLDTKKVLLVACGVPGIEAKRLVDAGRLGGGYITRFCGGGISRFEK